MATQRICDMEPGGVRFWDEFNVCGSSWTFLRERKLAGDVSTALLFTQLGYFRSPTCCLPTTHARTVPPPRTNDLLDPRFFRDSRSLLYDWSQPPIRDIDPLVPTCRLRIPAGVVNVGIYFQRGQRLEMIRWWSMGTQGKAQRPLFRQDPPPLGVGQRHLREKEFRSRITWYTAGKPCASRTAESCTNKSAVLTEVALYRSRTPRDGRGKIRLLMGLYVQI